MLDRLSPERRAEVGRFLAVGASNTLATLLVFWALTYVMPSGLAYTCAFALGLAYTTFMSSRVVFRVKAGAKRHAHFVAWYLIVYLVGLGAVWALESAEAPRLALVVGTVAITVPLNYFGGRFALAGRGAPAR